MDEQKIDSGFDDSPFTREMREYFRRRELYPIKSELLRECICVVYGWEKWIDDPWGNSASFDEWLIPTEDNALAVWAGNKNTYLLAANRGPCFPLFSNSGK